MSFETAELDCRGDVEFKIEFTDRQAQAATLISPDVATCDDCLKELFDPRDRRFRFPFINCTNCGPRFTIVKSIPYDRPFTSMSAFPMCPDCLKEYSDPRDRRFHAQPNACPICGPKLTLQDHQGALEISDPIQHAVAQLRSGKIVAVRGVGGFHLAVNPHDDDAVRELRRRKGRAEKPFALMAANLESISTFCTISGMEVQLLQHHTRPIVLLQRRDAVDLSRQVAPNNRYLGFMLPYSPLHHLLLRDNFDALVMTSGNYAEEPIAIGNEEALERLRPLADFVLLHDREILQRCDDSIIRCVGKVKRVIRRARGFVPQPFMLKWPTKHRILACGGELKNVVALSRDREIFLSQHIGDLDNPAALTFFEQAIQHLQKIMQIRPEIIAHDLHPEYLSTKWATKQLHLPKVGVQHHHAHLASVMAESGVDKPAIGIILDGTGYGLDGTIWGGEVLVGDFLQFQRFAWLEPIPMPGAVVAINEPWRMAISFLYRVYGREFINLNLALLKILSHQQVEVSCQMMEKQLNAPMTSSCGRLFDGISAILGIRHTINYEAQAAIELEQIVDRTEKSAYLAVSDESNSEGALSTEAIIRGVVDDLLGDVATGKIAARFHRSLAILLSQAARKAREATGVTQVALSGGVFQNVYFFEYLLELLAEAEFEILTHRDIPTNDGGIALGQVVIADAQLRAQ